MREIKRLQKQLENTEQEYERILRKVENPNFAEKAPREVVEKEKQKMESNKQRVIELNRQIDSLSEIS